MTTDLELPTHETSQEAGQALRRFAPIAERARTSNHVNVRADGASDSEQPVSVPRQAFDLFLEVLGQLANGNAVTIMPVQAELTTQQAADLLNVSRPHLVELLESHAIPFRRVGTHRRVEAAALLAYKRKTAAKSRTELDELTAEAQRLDLGY